MPSPVLSSRVLALAGLVAVSAAAMAATLTQVAAPIAPTAPPATAPSFLPPVPAWNDPLRAAVAEWKRLQQSDALGFPAYAAFLEAHPGWPGEAAMRRTAEKAIKPDVLPAPQVVAFFDRVTPTTSTGRLRYAEALAQLGRAADAQAQARTAWTSGFLSAEDETRFLSRFAGGLTQADNDTRMDMLLWARMTASAQRQMPLVSPERRPIYAARLAMQTRAPGAGAIQPGFDHDAGFIVDRALWLRDGAQGPSARAWLAGDLTLTAPPLDPQRWLETLLLFASGAAADNQPSYAYGIARQVDLAYPAGTSIRDRPLAERDPYTSLVWLGGQTALKKLARPTDATAMFERYARGAATPGSQTRGLYWAGRAAQASGDMARANGYYAEAAQHSDQFYGQLATERLGRPVVIPPAPAAIAIADTQRAAFEASEPVRVVRLLNRPEDWQDQTAFVRSIALNAKTQEDHQLAADLSRSIGRPDLGVMVARNARVGTTDPVRYGFPTIAVPPAFADRWTMIHAISRQESQFDREATSRVGAKGLMQLMPATAREQAGKLGLPYDNLRLTADPQYNVMLGSSFFQRMVTYYGGSIPLAVASYNAGPGNVNKFLRANGDPRSGQVDWIDWIEAIPLQETRGYVQHVLENAVVYDLLNPERSRTPARNRLSFYLGKSSAG